MKKAFCIIIAAFLLFACTGNSNEAPKTQKTQKITVPGISKKPREIKPVVIEEKDDTRTYVLKGKRDPFRRFEPIVPVSMTKETMENIGPLQKLSISQIKLVGVIWGSTRKALIEDASGTGYIIDEGTLIGENRGIITRITQRDIRIKQHFKDYRGRVDTREIILSLQKEEGEM
ncbi:MAG: pilus assembly protein PilP [Thermodesulfobacteriota bacterium]|nr:pilus assembly protein PilP [Thermodesulfobacteriota bacterium]